MRSPGEPLHPDLVSGVQEALPYPGFIVPSYTLITGRGTKDMQSPTYVYMPLVNAAYTSTDVPFTPVKTDYKP